MFAVCTKGKLNGSSDRHASYWSHTQRCEVVRKAGDHANGVNEALLSQECSENYLPVLVISKTAYTQLLPLLRQATIA